MLFITKETLIKSAKRKVVIVAILDALSRLPLDAWRIGLFGVIVLLILIACVPGAGDRLISFFKGVQLLISSWHHLNKNNSSTVEHHQRRK
jgi:hypothetical protein